jgi:hypothetical protein
MTESEAYGILEMKPRHIYAGDIQEAVADPRWQALRKSLKGLSTVKKLERLRDWYWHEHYLPLAEYHNMLPNEYYYVQVVNYVNALKRGGLIVND